MLDDLRELAGEENTSIAEICRHALAQYLGRESWRLRGAVP